MPHKNGAQGKSLCKGSAGRHHSSRSDPRVATVQSTNARPVVMEAHQRIGPPLPLSCCRAVEMTVENAEIGKGPVLLEVSLRDSAEGSIRPLSPGQEVVPSSLRGSTPSRGEEVLTFRFPQGTIGGSFNEITVAIRSEGRRDRAGAHLAIRSFKLIPR